MAKVLDRARQLVAAGPYDARPAEIAAVHAALYPDREAVCQTCRGELGRAYYAIQRWAAQQGAASDAPFTSSPMKKTSVARFKSDATIYTPHGLGVAYSNTNLTDKAARDIIQHDPDATALFSELPGEADEEEQDLTPAQASAEQAVTKAEQQAHTTPQDFDYAKLASAMVDELERRNAAASPARIDAAQQPTLTASAGGAEAGQESDNSDSNADTSGSTSDADSDSGQADEHPVRLSRANKEQLIALFRTELGKEPLPEATNDELRQAIAEHRAGQQDPE